MPEPQYTCTNCKSDFERRQLCCPSCGTIGVRKLYRYVRFDEYSLAMLKTKKAWFAKPSSFNDPFEWSWQPAITDPRWEVVNRQSILQAQEELKKAQGLFCLSERNDDLLMWGHYADKHSGFCVEFERTAANSLGNHCVPVIYSQDYPTFSIESIQAADAHAKIVTTKSVHWEHEKEWRVISRQGDMLHDLPGDITGIIFGLRMNQDRRRHVVSILGSSVKYFETQLHARAYRLLIQPLD